MTHEELLEEINFLPLDGLHAWMQPALRAVVELAITAVNGNPNTAYSMGYAAACERIIQAIEEALK